jgi:3-hydroxyisobutyrate dehydrogenase
MGSPIAMKLIGAGPVCVWGRNPEKLGPALAAGARRAASPRELAAQPDVVILCVTDTAAVEAVVFGDDGIYSGGRRGAILIDHSSIRPDATREMAKRLEAVAGIAWIDAPVSGGAPGVANKTLVVMCGGEQGRGLRANRPPPPSLPTKGCWHPSLAHVRAGAAPGGRSES